MEKLTEIEATQLKETMLQMLDLEATNIQKIIGLGYSDEFKQRPGITWDELQDKQRLIFLTPVVTTSVMTLGRILISRDPARLLIDLTLNEDVLVENGQMDAAKAVIETACRRAKFKSLLISQHVHPFTLCSVDARALLNLPVMDDFESTYFRGAWLRLDGSQQIAHIRWAIQRCAFFGTQLYKRIFPVQLIDSRVQLVSPDYLMTWIGTLYLLDYEDN
jgi:hypothetical protein